MDLAAGFIVLAIRLMAGFFIIAEEHGYGLSVLFRVAKSLSLPIGTVSPRARRLLVEAAGFLCFE